MTNASESVQTPSTAAEPAPASGSRRVLNWQVFKPGYWNKQYFSAADCRRVVENFHAYSAGESPYLRAKAKLGHDDKQRFAQLLGLTVDDHGRTLDAESGKPVSAGLPAMGRIVDCRSTPDGGFAIDIEGVPTAIADEIEAERLPDGSVELDNTVPDPADPSKTIPGYVLKAISFLGEEEPGVKGLPSPVVCFSQNQSGGSFRIKFREVTPMDRNQIIAALKDKGIDVGSNPALANLPDEALNAMLGAMPAANPANPTPTLVDDLDKKGDPNAAMAKRFEEQEKTIADMTAKFGSLEKAFSDLQTKAGDIQNAAKFAQSYEQNVAELKKQRCTEVVDKCVGTGRLIPALRDRTIGDLCLLSDDRSARFAEGEHQGKTPFEVELAKLLARTPDPSFSVVSVKVESETMTPERRAKLYGSTELLRSITRDGQKTAA
ncbi:MAG: hypothetical protein U0798_15160 [Gemmataceae bacterium]